MKRIGAAFSLFTRIPVWKCCDIPAAAYSTTVVYWPLTGWLTGFFTGLLIYSLSFILPFSAAVLSAFVLRILLTGALHEDGLADFCDGFGGGRDKEAVLRIMKDSHIGTYGVIGLIFYIFLIISLISSLSPLTAALAVIATDPFSKFCASQITNFLSYARPEGAKNKISYSKMNGGMIFKNALFGCLPLIPMAIENPLSLFSLFFPIVTLSFLILMMKRRIGGYTGDCCGATFLLCELSMFLGIVIIYGI